MGLGPCCSPAQRESADSEIEYAGGGCVVAGLRVSGPFVVGSRAECLAAGADGRIRLWGSSECPRRMRGVRTAAFDPTALAEIWPTRAGPVRTRAASVWGGRHLGRPPAQLDPAPAPPPAGTGRAPAAPPHGPPVALSASARRPGGGPPAPGQAPRRRGPGERGPGPPAPAGRGRPSRGPPGGGGRRSSSRSARRGGGGGRWWSWTRSARRRHKLTLFILTVKNSVCVCVCVYE